MSEPASNSLRLILIGVSTGGPRCIKDLFGQWHLREEDRIVVLQHMPYAMTMGYCKRLSDALGASVKVAVSGDSIDQHPVLLCPGLHQLTFARQASGSIYVRVTARKMNYLYAPSIDLAFSSLASLRSQGVFGLILTGMGNDGTQGAQRLKETGAVIVAQDPSEAAAPGMPSSVIEAGLADHVLTVAQISQFFSDPQEMRWKRAK